MLRFNTLLGEIGIDPKHVQLVRHQARGPDGVTPYALAHDRVDKFDLYQSIQGGETFRRELLASFVATPAFETLFVNLYKVGPPKRNSELVECPVSGTITQIGQCWIYPLSLDERLIDFSQKLVVEWGDGFRTWVQLADRQNKKVIEVRRRVSEPTFPGYLAFQKRIEEIEALYPTWQAALAASRGVYLLVEVERGGQYVGSATGERGFLGRWLAYARDGHGGNTILKERNHKNYFVSILETAGSGMERNDILAREIFWKEKLGSRATRLGDEFGLNAN